MRRITCPKIFHVTATLHPTHLYTHPEEYKTKRRRFYVAAETGKYAQARVRLHMRSLGLNTATICDGTDYGAGYVEQAMQFAVDTGAVIEVRKLKEVMRAIEGTASESEQYAAQFAARYRELANQ